jgi:predicted Zn finger-like uncharacterized protein
MIVRCANCQTKFKVADEKVGDAGTKVRCSRCQTTFVVRREDAVAEGAPAAAAPVAPRLHANELVAPRRDQTPLPPRRDRTPLPPTARSALDGAVSGQSWLDAPVRKEGASTPSPPPSTSSPSTPAPEPPAGLGVLGGQPTPPPAEPLARASSRPVAIVEAPAAPATPTAAATPEPPPSAPPTVTAAAPAIAVDYGQDAWRNALRAGAPAGFEAAAHPLAAPPPLGSANPAWTSTGATFALVEPPRRSRAGLVITLLLIAGLGGAGFAVYRGLIPIPGLSQRAPTSAPPSETEGLVVTSLHPRVAPQAKGPPRLVVEGTVANYGTQTRGRVRVRGVVLEGETELARKEAYGGTLLDDRQLARLSDAEIDAANVPDGADGSNKSVPSGGRVSFLIVFTGKDIPFDPQRHRVRVEVAGAEATAR